MNDRKRKETSLGPETVRRRKSLLRPLDPQPRPAARRRARAIALAFLIPFLIPACTSAKTVPRPEKWAQPVASTVLKNWYMVTLDLYRSEQPTRQGFEEIRAQGVRSIVNLRNDGFDDSLVEGLGFTVTVIPMIADSFTEPEIIRALKAIRDAPKPVLVHCKRGADRTGVVMAMYRVVFQDWSKEDAIAELKGGGYGFHWYYFNIPSFIKKANVARIKAALDLP